MNLLLSIIVCLVTSLGAEAQSWEGIKADPSLVWGEGWGRSIEEADNMALSSLASKITVAVSSDYRQVEEQMRTRQGTEYSLMQSNRVSASSDVTLEGSQRIVLAKGRKAHVGRWISRDELENFFDGRKARILEYERNAEEAETRHQVSGALKYHYWAYMLLRSLPRPSEMRGGDGSLLVNSIPQSLSRILQGISVREEGRIGNSIRLFFTYGGAPVSGLDYSYFDGGRWVKGPGVSSGRSTIEMMPGALARTLQIRVEYAYAAEASIDRELRSVLSIDDSLPLKGAMISFYAKK